MTKAYWLDKKERFEGNITVAFLKNKKNGPRKTGPVANKTSKKDN